jgi:hypothetical protein
MKLVPVVMGVHTYWMVVDAKEYPVAQGTKELCEKAMKEHPITVKRRKR